ncbi:hypothetical protein SDC9_171351 [bioreactor metagenome]|uniref:Uncharacterized protein n=1 Tax=bioreactor metagenome TaxID=1076179 RepID=A0A645GAM3_9ZZZZ
MPHAPENVGALTIGTGRRLDQESRHQNIVFGTQDQHRRPVHGKQVGQIEHRHVEDGALRFVLHPGHPGGQHRFFNIAGEQGFAQRSRIGIFAAQDAVQFEEQVRFAEQQVELGSDQALRRHRADQGGSLGRSVFQVLLHDEATH